MAKKKELSFSRFIKRFSTEKACSDYLYQVKWPEGFVCPKCGWQRKSIYQWYLPCYQYETSANVSERILL